MSIEFCRSFKLSKNKNPVYKAFSRRCTPISIQLQHDSTSRPYYLKIFTDGTELGAGAEISWNVEGVEISANLIDNSKTTLSDITTQQTSNSIKVHINEFRGEFYLQLKIGQTAVSNNPLLLDVKIHAYVYTF
eukprot:TRINITY_DN142_c0_g1_i1.p1 TRINITY_DN142_c0_g1~~TRINITY_DN142_c0_g1_i1.p1  ORF type:complete len:133 (-),score=58.22 TRINITY_DN142_c0_g1_i1:246-644(-)